MSASNTSEAPARAKANRLQLEPVKLPLVVRYLDLVALVLALPIFLLAGFSMLGYAVGGAAWVIQRFVQVKLFNRAAATDDPRTLVGITAGSMIGRGWFCALAIFGVGFYQDSAGLAAAILVISLFTVYLTINMIARPTQKPLPGKGASS